MFRLSAAPYSPRSFTATHTSLSLATQSSSRVLCSLHSQPSIAPQTSLPPNVPASHDSCGTVTVQEAGAPLSESASV